MPTSPLTICERRCRRSIGPLDERPSFGGSFGHDGGRECTPLPARVSPRAQHTRPRHFLALASLATITFDRRDTYSQYSESSLLWRRESPGRFQAPVCRLVCRTTPKCSHQSDLARNELVARSVCRLRQRCT